LSKDFNFYLKLANDFDRSIIFSFGEDGLLTEMELAMCVKEAQAGWNSCFETCTCEMPWCNCVPPAPELANPKFDVTCYPQ